MFGAIDYQHRATGILCEQFAPPPHLQPFAVFVGWGHSKRIGDCVVSANDWVLAPMLEAWADEEPLAAVAPDLRRYIEGGIG
jgi:hypothetical protein